MRGRHRSRTVESVVAEARGLVAEGVRELNLISQDTTYFGMDRWEEKAGPRAPVDSTRGDSLTACCASCKDRGRFLDPPALHASGPLERRTDPDHRRVSEGGALRRHAAPAYFRSDARSDAPRNVVAAYPRPDRRIRAGVPGIALRTTFIAGFPGETKEDFETLLQFIEETRFERLGVFRIRARKARARPNGTVT
jgi:ribosomal protein S12 methylthiotransferase